MLDIIQRHRKKGLQVPVDGDVPSRTMQALRILDLMDEAGRPTPAFEKIRSASEADLPTHLQAWLAESYADILKTVHPATSSELAIRTAFSACKPARQHARMVRLFMELFRAAGVEPARASAQNRRSIVAGSRRSTGTKQDRDKSDPDNRRAPSPTAATMPPALEGLLSGLPSEGESWSQEQRDLFMRAFETVLDYCFPPASPAFAAVDRSSGMLTE